MKYLEISFLNVLLLLASRHKIFRLKLLIAIRDMIDMNNKYDNKNNDNEDNNNDKNDDHNYQSNDAHSSYQYQYQAY